MKNKIKVFLAKVLYGASAGWVDVRALLQGAGGGEHELRGLCQRHPGPSTALYLRDERGIPATRVQKK